MTWMMFVRADTKLVIPVNFDQVTHMEQEPGAHTNLFFGTDDHDGFGLAVDGTPEEILERAGVAVIPIDGHPKGDPRILGQVNNLYESLYGGNQLPTTDFLPSESHSPINTDPGFSGPQLVFVTRPDSETGGYLMTQEQQDDIRYAAAARAARDKGA